MTSDLPGIVEMTCKSKEAFDSWEYSEIVLNSRKRIGRACFSTNSLTRTVSISIYV